MSTLITQEPLTEETRTEQASSPAMAKTTKAHTEPKAHQEHEIINHSGAAPFGHTPEYLLDVRLTVSAEIGRVEMPVRQVMLLAPGALVELQRSASEPVDILVNGHCIARGEIVVIGEHFGVRITELGTPLPTQR